MSSSTDETALEGTSIESLLSSLIVNFITAAAFLVIFIVLRTKLHRIYEPRAYVETLQNEKKMKRLPRTPWRWLLLILKTSRHKDTIIEKSGLDAYFFIRYLRMVIIMFVPALCITWPILLPLNIVGGVDDHPLVGQSKVSGLDRLAFGNVSRTHTSRYWAHLVLAYVFVIWICLVMLFEVYHFIEVRQEWIVSRKHCSKASATTILVTAIPKDLLDEKKLQALFSVLPGGVRHVWLNRDFSKLLADINDRDSIARKLELAELNLIKTAVRLSRKAGKSDVVQMAPISRENASSDPQQPRVDSLIAREQRPQHRLPLAKWLFSLPNWMLLGRKVDTIDWCKAELSCRNTEIENSQNKPDQYRPMNSAFIQFNRQIAAHMAVQSVPHHRIKAMDPRYLEVSPSDVIWTNMQMQWWERYLWVALIWAICLAITLFFAIPTAFIGSLSHITNLVAIAPWLGFLNTDKPGAKFWSGLVTGVLPSALIGILYSLVPLLMKYLARLQGHPTSKEVSLCVQDILFIFLFIQLFLVITISSGITALISTAVQDPTSIPQLLATDLPKASNFFFAYMLQQGLSVASGNLAQIWWIIVHYVATALTATPRSKWSRWNNLRTNTWGTTYPAFTNLAAIGIIYSIISPIIMLFVIVAFVLFSIAKLNNFMYVYDPITDTGGMSYPKAIQQLFVGIYFLELCLTGLFFLVRNADDSGVPCKIQAIFMIILIIITVVFQTLFYRNFHALVHYMPLDKGQENGEPDYDSAKLDRNTKSEWPSPANLESPSPAEGRYSTEQDESELDTHESSTMNPEYSPSDRESLLLEAFRHEALRRRVPIIWLPRDELGIAADEISRMPSNVPGSCMGARLDGNGKVIYETDPPDFVRSDYALL